MGNIKWYHRILIWALFFVSFCKLIVFLIIKKGNDGILFEDESDMWRRRTIIEFYGRGWWGDGDKFRQIKFDVRPSPRQIQNQNLSQSTCLWLGCPITWRNVMGFLRPLFIYSYFYLFLMFLSVSQATKTPNKKSSLRFFSFGRILLF